MSCRAIIINAIVGLGIVLGGCASVSVRKVPTPTQYARWTDDMQRRADEMEGIRFYLPRPFVSVFESFPVRTDIYIADGKVSPDGKYVIIQRIRNESGLSKYFASAGHEVSIPGSDIAITDQFGLTAKKDGSSTDTAPVKKPASISTGVDASTPPPQGSSPASAPPVRTGINQTTTTNNNGAFAYQPLRGNMDIVYIPDFEEQYVVASSAGLGNAQFSLNLGQGWSLQGLNTLTDNSEINRRIFDLIDNAMRLASAAATEGLGPVANAIGNLAAGSVGKFGLTAKKTMTGEVPGTPVTLKIVIVHYAAKGLYPVIKPRELQQRTTSDQTSYCVLDILKHSPKTEIVSALEAKDLASRVVSTESESSTYTTPRYPYQYISFNTFRYMAIELVRADAAPFSTLYDKTGTQGNPGDARVGEITQVLRDLQTVFAGAPSTPKTIDGTCDLATIKTDLIKAVEEGLAAQKTFGKVDAGKTDFNPVQTPWIILPVVTWTKPAGSAETDESLKTATKNLVQKFVTERAAKCPVLANASIQDVNVKTAAPAPASCDPTVEQKNLQDALTATFKTQATDFGTPDFTGTKIDGSKTPWVITPAATWTKPSGSTKTDDDLKTAVSAAVVKFIADNKGRCANLDVKAQATVVKEAAAPAPAPCDPAVEQKKLQDALIAAFKTQATDFGTLDFSATKIDGSKTPWVITPAATWTKPSGSTKTDDDLKTAVSAAVVKFIADNKGRCANLDVRPQDVVVKPK